MASKQEFNAKASKREVVRAYILARPTCTNPEVVKALGVSVRLASMVRSELRAEGLLPLKAFGDWTSSPAGPRDVPLLPPTPGNAEQVLIRGTAELMKKAEEAQATTSHEFSVEEQLALCRRFANDPNESAQVRLAALTVFNKIKSEIGAREELGPGKPLTDEDRIVRFALLAQALGFNTAVKAFERAFGGKGTNAPQVDSTNAAPAVPEATDAGGHDAGGGPTLDGASEGDVGQGPDPERGDQG